MQNKLAALIFVSIILFAPLSLALSSSSSSSPSASLQSVPISPQALAKISSYIDSTGYSQSALSSRTLIVTGAQANTAEKALLDQARKNNAILAGGRMVADGDMAMQNINSGNYALIVLVGGPGQNTISKQLAAQGAFKDNADVFPPYSVLLGHYRGSVVIIFSDSQGLRDQPRPSIQYSPLSAFMPPEYVPFAATVITLIIAFLLNLGKAFVEMKVSDYGKAKKKMGKKLMLYGQNVAEPAAIAAASIVLGLSLSWQYIGPTSAFLMWFVLNSAICFLTATSHELVHKAFAKMYRIPVEYSLWVRGSALTLFSAYLGNAFSLQGFLLEEIPEHIEKWKVGIMKLSAPIFSAIVMLVFAALNAAHPNLVYQTIYSSSALLALFELLPFSGTHAEDIRNWDENIWRASLVIVGIGYACVTFIF